MHAINLPRIIQASAFTILTLVSITSAGRELTDVTLDVTTSKKGAEAKQDAFDQAVEAATRQMTQEFLGPEKTTKVWPQAKTRLLKDSTRYVVFIKGSPPIEVAGDQTQIKVQMRLSPDNLEVLLRELNLLGGGSVRVLPLVAMSDHRGARYVWWADLNEEKTANLAQEDLKVFIKQLNSQFKNKNIFVLDPTNASFRMSVPASYRSESLRREDQALLAQYLKADVVISGRVEVIKPRLDSSEQAAVYNLEMWQPKNIRVLSELSRTHSVPSDTIKAARALLEQHNQKIIDELGTKLTEAMASGNLNLSVLRLAVEGSLNYQQVIEFRKQLSMIREIKQVRERLFEPSRVTFELESSVGAGDLAKSIEKSKFTQFQVKVEGTQDNGLVLSVRSSGPTSAQ